MRGTSGAHSHKIRGRLALLGAHSAVNVPQRRRLLRQQGLNFCPCAKSAPESAPAETRRNLMNIASWGTGGTFFIKNRSNGNG